MKSLGVFCGSSFGLDPVYRETAAELGRAIAARGWTLVYGGGRTGIMGVIAETALASGAEVVSVLPSFIRDKVGLLDGSEIILTETMHERKQIILDRSGALLAFPGGIGTMDEFFEAYTWSQLGLLKKPVGLLNVAGFYDLLIQFLDRQVQAGFLKQEHRNHLLISPAVEEILEQLAGFRYHYTGKWTEQINHHP